MATSHTLRVLMQPAKTSMQRVTARLGATQYRTIHRSAVRTLPDIAFKLADIGEGIAEVEVLQWFVHEGDAVHQFQHVCEVQSDKATVEITSRYDGRVKKLHYPVGTKAKVGTTLLDIEVPESQALNKPLEVPVAVGADLNADAETPPVLSLAPVEEVRGPPPMPEPLEHAVGFSRSGSAKVLTSPAVRRLAREHGIDLLDVPPTGPAGRILKEDVLGYIRHLSEKQHQTASSVGSRVAETVPEDEDIATPSSDPDTHKTYQNLTEDTIMPLTPTQRKMVQTMTAALQVPHFNYGDEIQMDALHQLKETLKPVAASNDVKLTYMPFFIKAASLALRSYPMLNARMNDDLTSIKLLAAHNISIAIDTPEGLVVPNIKHVESKSVMEIACDLERLHELAIDGSLMPADLSGGTFSLSNIGILGGTFMSPLLLVPQVAIGAVGKIHTVPRFADDGSVKPVRLMSVGWSGDHRVIDGATIARFSNKWKEYVETPSLMLAELR